MNRLATSFCTFVVLLLIASASSSVFAADSESEKALWLRKKMDLAYSIKPGMTVEQLLEVFQHGGGAQIESVYTDKGSKVFARLYVLRDLHCIKIDVQFDETISLSEPKAGAKIIWVSKPYLEHEVLD